MTPPENKPALTTLRQAFSRRLMLLLTIFSLVTGSLITAVYLRQTSDLNRATLTGQLSHLKPRIREQQQLWDTDADHVLRIIEWSGLLAKNETLRSSKLLALFTAQAESLEFEGVAIMDSSSGKPLFDYWRAQAIPRQWETFPENQSLWYDEKNGTLYSVIQRFSTPHGQNLRILFFKAWDNAMLRRMGLPDTITIVSLGAQPLLSSAGNLALQSATPPADGYATLLLDGVRHQEDSIKLAELRSTNGGTLPLKLTVREPFRHDLPISTVLASSVGITLLFGLLLFIVLGNWLRRLGARLDKLTGAALQFQNEQTGKVSPATRHLLEQADAGKGDQISVVSQELSSLMTSAAERDAEQRGFLQTLDLLQDAVIEISPDGHLLRATATWKAMSGQDDLASGNIDKFVHPDDSAALMEQFDTLIHEEKNQINIRFRLLRRNRNHDHLWVEGRFGAVEHDGKVTSIRGVIRDITHTYQQEHQINHMALHDALTDLPNRVLLEDRMQIAIARAARGNLRVALGFIDLDHFKQVNDNFGHKMGDRMLKEVTQRLTTALRSSDTLSRWGGDEFVVLCPDLCSVENARSITKKLELLTRENITIDGTDFPFTFSAGFAVFPDDADNSEMLLAQADRAMFYAKAQGRNNIQFFNNIIGNEPGRQSFYIQSRLMQAVQNNQIQCWLQPIVSAQSGRVTGAEALARWYEPEQGWIPPSVFIPMAESMGLIDKVGQAVWQQALQALILLPEHHRLSVNLSKRQLFSNTIVQQLLDDVERARIEPGRITLELTESIAFSDVTYARDRIAELDKKGFSISVDDFGVGYSSLSQLHEIPADELKLDISFVKRIHSKSGFSMATAIISIAKSLDMECVAEGVEDAATATLLGSMGAEMLQGYHFAKPMPINDYQAWLTAYNSG